MTHGKCVVRRIFPPDMSGYSERRELDKKEVKP